MWDVWQATTILTQMNKKLKDKCSLIVCWPPTENQEAPIKVVDSLQVSTRWLREMSLQMANKMGMSLVNWNR